MPIFRNHRHCTRQMLGPTPLVLGHVTSRCKVAPPKSIEIAKRATDVEVEGNRSNGFRSSVVATSYVRAERYDPMHFELAGNSMVGNELGEMTKVEATSCGT
ncbi:unnamed protein product [Dovyalis caffra]|uniref:Uncharacterized protein n=1 Tax=Dovyalis caffra TaxID=77055 RepID=A0AAV1SWN7_9ROSI|nr:unnamed protein product [Dovyalis caffra]